MKLCRRHTLGMWLLVTRAASERCGLTGVPGGGAFGSGGLGELWVALGFGLGGGFGCASAPGATWSRGQVEGQAQAPVAPGPRALAVHQGHRQVTFRLGDIDILTYQAAPGDFPRPDIDPIYRRGGYIQSLRTPGGRRVTDDYPPDHTHHHGVWFAWVKTEVEELRQEGRRRPVDFWNMHKGTGLVRHTRVLRAKVDGAVGHLDVEHAHVMKTPEGEVVVADEVWRLKVMPPGDYSNRRPYWRLEVVSRFVVRPGYKLHVLKHRYGGLGVRGPWAWKKDTPLIVTTASGTGRLDADGARTGWIDMSGQVSFERGLGRGVKDAAVDARTVQTASRQTASRHNRASQMAGITVIDHPANPKAPQPVRMHPEEPYFSFAPARVGGFTVSPGVPFVSRYHIVVHDGPFDPDFLKTGLMP